MNKQPAQKNFKKFRIMALFKLKLLGETHKYEKYNNNNSKAKGNRICSCYSFTSNMQL